MSGRKGGEPGEGRLVLAGPEEHVCMDARRHSIVLARPFTFALVLALAGGMCFRYVWPLPLVGAASLALGALVALRAVWRWERTHIVVTTEKVFVVQGTLRRRAAALQLRSVEAIGLEQSLAGRILGYGTLVAGTLKIAYVPEARRVYRLVERLAV